MKIAHISIIPQLSAGILNKIKDKANIATSSDLAIDFYILNFLDTYKSENLYIIKQFSWIPNNFLRLIAFRLFKMHAIKKHIPLDDYDAIVLRYPLIDGVGYQSYAKQYGHKTFTEHHTDEVSELYSQGGLINTLRAYLEKKRASSFLSKVAGIIAVTNEIREIEVKKAAKNVPSLTLANGINPNNYLTTGFLPFNKETQQSLSMVFMASTFYSWHGLELLMEKLQHYNGDTRITLHLVGKVTQVQKKQLQSTDHVTIIPHGSLYGESLDILLKKVSIGISSLALSNNNMQEACPLKSREYIIRKLPFIYAYNDTDLHQNTSFALRMDEKKYTIKDIINFAEYVSKHTTHINTEFSHYIDIISWENKLKQLNKFIITQELEVRKSVY